jgi:excisionase family DNA binding protein
MDIETAARYLCANPWAVEVSCRNGELRAFKYGKKWIIAREVLDEYVERRTREAETNSQEEAA